MIPASGKVRSQDLGAIIRRIDGEGLAPDAMVTWEGRLTVLWLELPTMRAFIDQARAAGLTVEEKRLGGILWQRHQLTLRGPWRTVRPLMVFLTELER